MRPLELGAVVGLSIFLIEIALMLLRIPSRLGAWEALFDAGLLTILVSPILYVLLLRPLAAGISTQKQAEAALLESKLQLQAAQRLAGMGSWSWDIATDAVTWSEELYAIHGLDPELPPPNFAEQPASYTPESWSELNQAVERAVRTGEPYELEFEIVRPDGEHRWITAMGVPVRGEDGQIRGLHGTVQDIEEEKQAALRLQESEETWRTLVNAIPDSLLLMDAKRTVLVANEAAAARVGRSVQEMVGANNEGALPEEETAARRRAMEEVVRTRRPVRFQDRLHDRDIDYHVHPVLDGQGRVARLAVLGVDLTEHKQAEEALVRAGAATQTLLGIVSRLDAELSLTDTLQALCEETLRAFSVDGVSMCLYNKAANAFIDAASAGLPAEYHEQGQPISKALYDHYVGHMGPLILVPDVQAVDGLPDQGLYASLDIRNAVAASMVREGELIGILSLLCRHEVREFTPDELSLLEGLAGLAAEAVHGARLRDQLRQGQKMEAIGRFAGGVVHDFNNLLTAVVGYADLTRESLPPDSEAREYLTEIQKAADRATILTRSLLAFSRRQIFAPHVLDLNEVANAITGFLERIIGEDIDLAFVRDPSLFPVEADPGQIEQVIMNLVINARDAIAGEGTITLETANVELDETYASTHPSVEPGPYVMLAVSDTGTGMDQATLAQVFEPFFTTKEVGEGTGLGLAVVYGIVKQNGGNIWAYSEPGSGSTFKVHLPRAEKPVDWRPTLRGTPVEPAGVGEETILLVEDDPAVRQLAANILEDRGYDVLQAASPEEGIALFDGHEGMVHLVLTDVVLPRMSGRAMVDRLLERRRSFFPVLYMSGYTRNAIVHEGRLDPDIDFLEKPFTPETLARKVHEILDSPQRGQ